MKPPKTFDSKNRIGVYLHCKLCLQELPVGEAPRDWAHLEVGFTEHGVQVWCARHEMNVVHIWFEGHKHPAITGRDPKKEEIQ